MKRLYHFDLLRITATIGVIILHISSIYVYKFNSLSFSAWFFANIINASMRFSVPIFFMISGAFLLLNDKPTRLKKRLPKILIPLFFASISYILLFKHDNANYNIYKGLLLILKGPISAHLWFIYALAGLYLLTPLLKFFTKDKKATEYFLILWLFFSVIIAFFRKFTQFSFGLDLNLFQGYIGLYVLGFYLSTYEFRFKKIRTLTLFFLIGFISTFIGTWLINIGNHGTIDEYFYTPLSPTVVLMSVSIFLLFKKIFQHKEGNKITDTLSEVSFGVYLYHALFIMLITRLPFIISTNNYLNIPTIIAIEATLVTIASYSFSFALSKIRFVKYLFLGIKNS